MIFTQQQIDEIRLRLATLGAKDTQFTPVSLPLNGGDIVAVVQQGENKQISINDFYEQLFKGSISYNADDNRIEFLNTLGNVLAYIDTAPFLEDLVKGVSIDTDNRNLVIQYNNKDRANTLISLNNIFNPQEYYNKTEIDTALATRANKNGSSSESFEADKIIAGAIKNPSDGNRHGVMVPVTQTDNEFMLTTSDGRSFGCFIRYNSAEKRIYLYNNEYQPLAWVDATDFIKDGMIDNVYIAEGNLVITFNTEAGKEDIEIPLTKIFDPDEYYTKEQVDTKIDNVTPFIIMAGISPTGVKSIDKTIEEINIAYRNRPVRIKFTHAPLSISFEEDVTRHSIYHSDTESWSDEFVAHTIANGIHYILKIYDEGGTTQLSFEALENNNVINLTNGVHTSSYYENLMRKTDIVKKDSPQIFVYTSYVNNISQTAICFSTYDSNGFVQHLILGSNSNFFRKLSNNISDGYYEVTTNWSEDYSQNLLTKLKNLYWKVDLDNLLNQKQPTLVSGTNIKTINGESVLGSGNIDTNNVFVATYGSTSIAEIEAAVNAGKVVIVDYDNSVYYLQGFEGTVDDQWYEFISCGYDVYIQYVRCITHDQGLTSEWEHGIAFSKTIYINQSSTNTDCPTAKAVYDFVQEQISDFITVSVDNLTNYYLKSETYTKTEVQSLIGAIQQFHYEIYPNLPQSGESNVLYLIGPTGSGNDKYEEYVYANNTFVKIGDTSIDLSGYVTTQALNTELANYVTSSTFTTALATKQDNLVSGINIKSINNQSVLGNGNLDVKDVFFAEYGVTTYQQVLDAYNEGKVVYCYNNFAMAIATYLSTNAIHFHGVSGSGFVALSLSSNNAWSISAKFQAENMNNKATDFTTLNNTKYPTTKAVADYAQPQTAIYNVQPNTTTLDANVDTYYNFLGTVDSCTITLPLMTTATTTLKNIIFNLTCGSTPAIVINGAEVTTDETQDVVYFANYLIEANKSYEINALWNGSKWVIGAAEITIPTEVEEVEE